MTPSKPGHLVGLEPTAPESPGSPLHRSTPHESGARHTTGAALYVDDLPRPRGLLVALPLLSPHARARILSKDASAATGVDGVAGVFFAEDVPGDVRIGPVVHDEPVLALGEVHHVGQVVAIVVGTDLAACRAGAAQVTVEYEPQSPTLDIQRSIDAEDFHGTPHVIERGDVAGALASADLRITGEMTCGGQDHFYLETQVALVIPGEDDTLRVYSSTQHPTEVQRMVAHTLGIGHHKVIVEVPRLGGGFGGKESQAANFAVLAALAARSLGRPVKMWLNRDQDMMITGKRHPFLCRYDAGLSSDGQLRVVRAELYADGGWVTDLSLAILDRALFHVDNAYFIPSLRLEGRVCRTNLPSNTAFRGFGGPQGMLVIEEILSRAAERLGKDPAELRQKNFYGPAPRDLTPYGQSIDDDRSGRIWKELKAESDYDSRRREVETFNARASWVRRGLAFQPVKFGISFTTAFLNQAGALLLIYADGTVHLNHGGIEMGQGLHSKMLAICSDTLGVDPASIRVVDTATDKVPNTSATAASSGSDLNGQAVQDAARQLRERMRPAAAEILNLEPSEGERLVFDGGRIFLPEDPAGGAAFSDVAQRAWFNRISLAATGFYRTPGIRYDREAGRGRPFYYFAYGGAVVEVELNGLTGEHRMLRADILHDAGRSLLPNIDRGQVEGAFIQGCGWLTCEEVRFDDQGHLLTHSPSTYKIPAFGDAPEDFRVRLLDRAAQPGVIGGSKAVGEPPFMLAIGLVSALRHAVQSFGPGEVELNLPATPEALLRSVEQQSRKSDAKAVDAP